MTCTPRIAPAHRHTDSGFRRYDDGGLIQQYWPLTQGISWKAEYARLTDETKLCHYSPKTLKTYRHWVRYHQTFTRSLDPQALTTEHVKAFLTFLAVDQKVSAATQNLAFNALLFFHRHVLKKDFGTVDGVVRAKRKPYIPVVLSRDEEVLTVHDGKGGKDRTLVLPEVTLPELRAQLESLKVLHQRDLGRGYGGVFLINVLEKKYPNPAKDFIWQWFFPALQLTPVPLALYSA